MKYYVICSSPRAGSNLLGSTLAAMNAGIPKDYFNPRLYNTYASQHAGQPEDGNPMPNRYIDHLKQTCAANGIFGFKAHYAQLARIPQLMENFTQFFPEADYIYITRRNILRQAISTSRAMQTNVWVSRHAETVKPRYNLFGIIKHIILIAYETERWEQFYARHGIRPLRIVYEDLEENYEATMRKVTDFLGISGDIPPPSIKKLADTTTEEWIRRFTGFCSGKGLISASLRFLVRSW
jgi:LPS sulfotransferase NodH